jgi:hypothetical protein
VTPDPAPGVAVSICGSAGRHAKAIPEPWPANDRIGHAAAAEHWPVTPDSIILYGLWCDHGPRALCEPLTP